MANVLLFSYVYRPLNSFEFEIMLDPIFDIA